MNLIPKETILITGATGLVGSEIIKLLDKERYNIIGLARNIPENSPDGVTWKTCDVLDIVALEEALAGVSQVYHCAGFVSFDPKLRKRVLKVNIEGTANLVNACIKNGVKKLLHVSSVAAIGEAKGANRTINEKVEWQQKGASDYGKSKYYGEIEVWRGLCEGLEAVIINPSVIIGAGDWNHGSTAMFKSVYDRFPWYTEGVHGFVDVQDVARAAIALMASGITGERFIINGVNLSYRKLFEMIAARFNVPPPYKKVTPLMAEFVWRFKYIKSKLTGKSSILNKNTARTALSICEYDGSKLNNAIPDFRYTDIETTVARTCKSLVKKYGL